MTSLEMGEGYKHESNGVSFQSLTFSYIPPPASMPITHNPTHDEMVRSFYYDELKSLWN